MPLDHEPTPQPLPGGQGWVALRQVHGKPPRPLCRALESPLSVFSSCIGTINLTGECNPFGVPPSGGSDRLKPGHQTVGTWKDVEMASGAIVRPACCRPCPHR